MGGFREESGEVVFLLGPPGLEMKLNASNEAQVLIDFSEAMGRIEAKAKTPLGEGFLEVQAQYAPRFRLKFPNASGQTRDALRSLNAVGDTHLSFVYADDWFNYSERYLMETTTTFTMRSTPYQRHDEMYNLASLGATLGNFAVFTDRNLRGENLTADLFSAYSRATRVVTVTPAQSIGDVVYMNYSFKGARVAIAAVPTTTPSKSFTADGERGLIIPLVLEGV